MTEDRDESRITFKDDDFVCPITFWAEGDYERAVQLSDDAMPETYAAWKEKLAEIESLIPPEAIVVYVRCDPDEVAEWCRRNGRKVTADDRAAYTLMKFRSQHGI